MSLENPHLLEKEIHSSHDASLFSSGHFLLRIKNLTSAFSSTNPRIASVYAKLFREYNKQVSSLGLTELMLGSFSDGSMDAGFGVIGDGANDGLNEVQEFMEERVLQENRSFLLLENGDNLIADSSFSE